jgi:hypothetical protein
MPACRKQYNGDHLDAIAVMDNERQYHDATDYSFETKFEQHDTDMTGQQASSVIAVTQQKKFSDIKHFLSNHRARSHTT